jgi:NAD(P)-dependent dehydrogenase (short-subunit alcohol dehydrogenase family)
VLERVRCLMDGIQGRTYIVTGAASGIGRGTASRLVAAGSNVALVDRDRDRVAAVAQELSGPGERLALGCDVTDPGAVDAAVAATVERFGGVHGVVTSAGIFHPADMVDLDAADLDVFDEVLDVNLRGTVNVLKAVLPRLGPGGAIVTIASTAGLRGHGLGPGYTASKGAVVALTRLVAVQYGPRGIRANCVCPGATAGEGMGATFQDPGVAQAVSADLPLRRVGTGDDLGATVAALLSDETRYVTGQVVAVDGGATIR